MCSLNGNVILDKTGHLSKYKSFLICRFANVVSEISALILFSVITFILVDITVLLCVHAQSCLTLNDPMDYYPPGSSVHGTYLSTLSTILMFSMEPK